MGHVFDFHEAVAYEKWMKKPENELDFDLEIAKKQSNENPVYYVQYAHARIASIMRLAEEKQIDFSDGNVGLLVTEPELTLIRKLLQFPETKFILFTGAAKVITSPHWNFSITRPFPDALARPPTRPGLQMARGSPM